MRLRFYLLGSVGVANPSAIPLEKIKAWEAQGLVEYLGEASDVRPYIESASCVVLPSFYKEGLPRVLLEAMSMGKPIITTDVSGCRECVFPPFTPLTPPAPQNLARDSSSPVIASFAKQKTSQDSADSMDCHAVANALARNDEKNTESHTPPKPQDSKIFDESKHTPAQAKSQAAGFRDDFCGCQTRNEGATLKVVTEIECADSTKSTRKPTPQILLGVNGVLIPPHSAPALAESCAYLATHAELARTMGLKGRELVKAHFAMESVVSIYRDCVRHLAPNPHARDSHPLSLPKKLWLRLALRGSEASAVMHQELESSPTLDSMDYHAVANAPARNDEKNTESHTPPKPQDSKICSKKPILTEMPQDSRIFDEKSGLFKEGQGRALEVRNRRPSAEIALLSQKAKSPSLVFVSNTCFGMYNFRLHPLRALRDEGYAIHIIAPHDSSTPKLKSEGFTCHHLRLDSRSLNPLKDLRTAMSLFTLLRRIRPALIFNYTIKPAIYGSLIARVLKTPYIAVITGLGYVFINDRGKTSSLKKKLLRALVCTLYRIALKNAKEVWFLNCDDEGVFLTRRLIAQEQARLLPSEGVDTAHFAPPSQEGGTNKGADKESEQNEECFTFLLIARMLWDKGVGEFVEAAQILRNEMKQDSTKRNRGGVAPKLRFILLGSVGVANPSAISRETIAQWEAQGLVEYLGEASDVRPYIESASCVVLPSYREGAPMVLLEAMSMGKPIITTDVSGCRECIAPPLTPLPLFPFPQARTPLAPLTAQNLAQDSHSPVIKNPAKQSTETKSKGIDCHDSASTESRNDKGADSPTTSAQSEVCLDKPTPTDTPQDSRIFDEVENTPAQTKSQAAGFRDDFCGCQDVGKGAHLRCVTADHSADSTKSARKPTPQILLGVNGVLIPPHSAPALAQAMHAMFMLDSSARKKLGTNARELVLRHHDKHLITRLYLHTAQKHASSLPPKQP